VESVLTQDHPPAEYLLVDGGSTDGSAELLAALPAAVTVLRGPDRGQSDAINKGLRRATGEIVSWINVSDLYAPGAFRTVAEFFRDHPDVVAVFGRARLIGEEGEDLGTYPCGTTEEMTRLNGRPDGHLRKLLAERSGWIPQQTVFWRRSVHACAGYLDEDLHYAMDYDYWIRLARCGAVVFLDAELGVFRLHPDAKSRRAARQWAEVLRIQRRHGGPLFCRIHAEFLRAAARALIRRTGLVRHG
jgi:glycosyltransferase involved in cell wall biosynthesis